MTLGKGGAEFFLLIKRARLEFFAHPKGGPEKIADRPSQSIKNYSSLIFRVGRVFLKHEQNLSLEGKIHSLLLHDLP